MTRRSLLLSVLLLVAAVATPVIGQGPAPKAGGVLKLVHREDLPQGFHIHESATNSVTWPAMPCYSNLVIFDQLKKVERTDTIVPELAEKWSWQDGYRSLVFFLRKDVKWHDGHAFTAKDVKFTFDTVREAPDAPAKLRLNPRKEWYANIEGIETPDAHTVVFRLKRPQPSLLTMLASGYSPVIPAHVPVAEHRTRCIGTGPFKFKEWKRGESVELVKNPDYFVKGRPYLDGVRFPIVVERGTGHEDDPATVAGDGREEAVRDGGADPEEARGGRRAPGDGLADRPVRHAAVREEPGPAPGRLQLLPAPGSLVG